MNQVDSCIINDNAAFGKLVEKQSCRLKDIRRRYGYKNGKYHDLLLYSLLREEFFEVIDKLKYG